MINLNYSLNETDLLNLQLYFASTDKETKRLRRREKYRMLGLSVLCGIILLFDEDYRIYSYYFLGTAILFYIVYPWWSPWFYKRLYKKQVSSVFKDKLTYNMNVILSDEYIEIENHKGHKQIQTSDIKSIIETREYFFITTDQTINIPIPKSNIEDIEKIREQIAHYSTNSGVSFSQDLNWKWK